MSKLKIYLDTSVIGAVMDIKDKERVAITEKTLIYLKKHFQIFISNLTLSEINNAPQNVKDKLIEVIKEIKPIVLGETEKSIILAENYIEEKIIPKKYRDDARHIAIAVLNEVDVIVSWNYNHMVNLEKKTKINTVNLKLGYRHVDIISPLEVVP